MSTTLVQGMARIPALGWIIDSVGTLIPYLFVIAAFTFAYIFVPNTRVRLGPAIVGALVAGVLWQSVGWGFASFMVGSTKYAAVYSGFAILILFMIWLYLAWLILLVGASIAFYQQHPEYLKLPQAQAAGPGNRARERLGLLSLCLIAKQHFEGAPPLSAEQLATRFGTTPDWVHDTLWLLQDKGLLVALNSTPETYLPAQAPERITVHAALTALCRIDERPHTSGPATPLEQAVTEVFTAVERATTETLHGLTIRDLVLGGAPDRLHRPGSIKHPTSLANDVETPH
jgi:membrane protein